MKYHKQLRNVELKRFLRKNKTKRDLKVFLILLNLSYARNVASVFRTADAFSVDKVYLVGCTPTPPFGNAMKRVSRNKENSLPWEYNKDFLKLVLKLKRKGTKVFALELATEAKQLKSLSLDSDIAIVVGNEEHGIPDKYLEFVDDVFYIPMGGKGKSLNVATTVALGLYQVSL